MQKASEKYSYVTEQDYSAVAGPDWPEYHQFINHLNVPDFVYNEIDCMLRTANKFSHPTFCVNPFYAREIPSNSSCCLLPHDHDIESIKHAMLNNQRHPDCEGCYKLEDAGVDSDRLIKNRSIDHWSKIGINKLLHHAEQNNNWEMMYKIDTSNACNATCVTCSSGSSTSWAKLEQQNNLIPTKPWSLDIDFIDIDYNNARMIDFRGGEPLLSQTNFAILENLLNAGNTDCFISFITNASVKLTKRQTNILKSFKNINMCCSIDGTGAVFEYLRYPLKWKNCVDNVNWYKDQGFTVSVSYTISNINLLEHAKTVNWFKENNLPYLTNPVVGPSHFRPGALPLAVKNRLLKENMFPELTRFLDNHTKQDDIDWEISCLEIAKQDAWKGINIKDYITRPIGRQGGLNKF